MTDVELIARVLANDDRHAFSTLVHRHQSSVRALLCKLTCGDTFLADDLAQETFLRAWKGLARFRGGARFSTWLFRIAYNIFLSDVRCTKLRQATSHGQPLEQQSASMDRVIARADLERAFVCLRPDERAALALTYGQEVTHEEAASILDWPLGTLKTHVLRAKESLRLYFKNAEARP